MIVADASAAISALLGRGIARDRFSVEALHAPHLIDSEVAHTLRRAVRSGGLSARDATMAVRAWGSMGVARYGAAGLLPRIWDLRDNLSAYDATYAALAETLGCPLLTSDARLAAAPGLECEVQVVPR